MDVRAHEQIQDGGDYTVEEDLGCDQDCKLRGGGTVVWELITPHGDAHPLCFSLVGTDRKDNPSIGNSLARWDLGVVDEEDGVCTLDAVTYTLRQPSNAVGESCGPGVFIGSAYKLCVPLGFLWRGKVPLGKLRSLPLRSPLYGWPVRVIPAGTYGVSCVRGDPPLVVVLGVVLVNSLEALWVAPSEVLGGL